MVVFLLVFYQISLIFKRSRTKVTIMHFELPSVKEDMSIQGGFPSESLVTERTLEQIIDAFMDYSHVVLESFLALVRLLTQGAIVSGYFTRPG